MTLTPPLIAMMSGAKVRARRERVPAPKEIILHVWIADLLRQHCLPDWRWTHINRKAKDAREGAIFKTMGVHRGWFDFELISPEPRPYFMDPKRLGEDLTDDQVEFQDWCLAHRIPAVAVWTTDDVLAAFEEWGCLRVVVPKRREP